MRIESRGHCDCDLRWFKPFKQQTVGYDQKYLMLTSKNENEVMYATRARHPIYTSFHRETSMAEPKHMGNWIHASALIGLISNVESSGYEWEPEPTCFHTRISETSESSSSQITQIHVVELWVAWPTWGFPANIWFRCFWLLQPQLLLVKPQFLLCHLRFLLLKPQCVTTVQTPILVP